MEFLSQKPACYSKTWMFCSWLLDRWFVLKHKELNKTRPSFCSHIIQTCTGPLQSSHTARWHTQNYSRVWGVFVCLLKKKTVHKQVQSCIRAYICIKKTRKFFLQFCFSRNLSFSTMVSPTSTHISIANLRKAEYIIQFKETSLEQYLACFSFKEKNAIKLVVTENHFLLM